MHTLTTRFTWCGYIANSVCHEAVSLLFENVGTWTWAWRERYGMVWRRVWVGFLLLCDRIERRGERVVGCVM